MPGPLSSVGNYLYQLADISQHIYLDYSGYLNHETLRTRYGPETIELSCTRSVQINGVIIDY